MAAGREDGHTCGPTTLSETVARGEGMAVLSFPGGLLSGCRSRAGASMWDRCCENDINSTSMRARHRLRAADELRLLARPDRRQLLCVRGRAQPLSGVGWFDGAGLRARLH